MARFFTKLKSKKKNFYYIEDRNERAKFISNIFKKYLINSILDVGCYQKLLKKYISFKDIYVGIDINGDPDLYINLEKEKLERFKNDSFYVVICTEVLEHLDNLHEVFDDICRVSKKYIIISLPNTWIDLKFDLLRGSWNYKHYGIPVDKPIDRHKWFFNYDQVFKFL